MTRAELRAALATVDDLVPPSTPSRTAGGSRNWSAGEHGPALPASVDADGRVWCDGRPVLTAMHTLAELLTARSPAAFPPTGSMLAASITTWSAADCRGGISGRPAGGDSRPGRVHPVRARTIPPESETPQRLRRAGVALTSGGRRCSSNAGHGSHARTTRIFGRYSSGGSAVISSTSLHTPVDGFVRHSSPLSTHRDFARCIASSTPMT